MFEAIRGMDTLLSIILLFMWGITLISSFPYVDISWIDWFKIYIRSLGL